MIPRESTGSNFWNHRSKDTPLRRSLPRAQGDERIEYHPVDLQALAECALARAKCPLGRNADVVDAGLPWRCLDALDQLRLLALGLPVDGKASKPAPKLELPSP